MMGALGNGRRGGRSPSLLVAALIACVLLLGFNYWVSNSRNVELQSRMLEMESRMRQLAADRDREQQSKLKVEEEMRRQNEQLELMEETHQRQQDTALNTWKLERENLKLNISSNAKTVQDMKNQMKSLMEDVNKMQSELKSCHSNMDTLSKKATSEMTQCNKQVEAIKEECNVKIAAAKLEKQKASDKLAPQNADGSMQKVSVSKAKSDVPATNHSDINAAEPPKSKPEVNSQSKKDVHVQTNELVVEKDEKGKPEVASQSKKDAHVQTNELVVEKNEKETVTYTCHYMTDRLERFDLKISKLDLLKKKRHLHLGCPWDAVILQDSPIPTSKPTNKNETLNKAAKEEVPEAVVDIKAQALKDADTVMDEAEILDPKEDDMGIGDEKEEDAKIEDRKEEDVAIGKEDAIMYDNEGEIEKQLSKIKDENQGAGQDLEDDVANYNGDDENQPESEDEKQAELAEM